MFPSRLNFIFNYLKIIEFAPECSFANDFDSLKEHFLEKSGFRSIARETFIRSVPLIDKPEINSEGFIILNDRFFRDVWLMSYVYLNYEELDKIFPNMREVLEHALKLSKSQISELENGDLIPKKYDFIFIYLKQINFDPAFRYAIGFGEDVDMFSDFEYNVIKSRDFNSVARVALLKISPKCEELHNQLIKNRVCLACFILALIVVLCLVIVGIAKQGSGRAR